MIVLLAQSIFFAGYLLLYVISGRTAHRMVGYFEEEAINSYTEYLAFVDSGKTKNIDAPQLAIDYWQLPANAKLRDVIITVRSDEVGHRDVNHAYANQ